MTEPHAENGGKRALERAGGSLVYVVTPEALDVDLERGGDLISLWLTLWREKWTIIIATVLITLAATAYSLLADKWYRAELVMVAAEPHTDHGGLADQLGNLGGLAGIAGLSIGAKSSAEPLAVLRSRQFLGGFIADYHLIPVLFPQDFDSAGRCRSSDPSSCPDRYDAFKKFSEKVLDIAEDKKTGLVTVGVEWIDPALAASWANLLVERLNERMRQRALEESAANVDYLKRELAGATVVPLQQSIGRLLQSELQKAMLARVTTEFAFRVVDRAEVPKWRVWPKRAQLIALAMIIGGLLSSLCVLGLSNVREKLKRAR